MAKQYNRAILGTGVVANEMENMECTTWKRNKELERKRGLPKFLAVPFFAGIFLIRRRLFLTAG